MSVICTACGHTNADSHTFCERCGTRLPTESAQDVSESDAVVCPSCGYANRENRVRCAECGARLPAAVPVSAPAAPPRAASLPPEPAPVRHSQVVLPPPPPQTNRLAILSLVTGVLGVVLLPLILSIPAIALGGRAKEQIRVSYGTQRGDGLATAGQVLGYVGILLAMLLCLCLGVYLLVQIPGPGLPGR